MPHIHQRKYHSHLHKVKRLHHHAEHLPINQLPANLFDEKLVNKSPKYIKFFDYPLPQLLADHSTDPLQNSTRNYFDQSLSVSNEGRFVNHEMIIRRNGETTILRPKQDLVLANGFTPIIRPSSILPSYQAIISHSQVESSLSIMNKMSNKKSEPTRIIKTKRKNRHRRKRCHQTFTEQNHLNDYHFPNEYEHNHHPQQSDLIHLFKETLYELIEQKKNLPPQPLPLMSILPQFHNPQNQSFPSQLNETHFNFSPPFTNEQPFKRPLLSLPNTCYTDSFCDLSPPFINEQPVKRPLLPLPDTQYTDSFYDLSPKQYYSFEQNHQIHFNPPPREHICMPHYRDYNHMPGYFFD